MLFTDAKRVQYILIGEGDYKMQILDQCSENI